MKTTTITVLCILCALTAKCQYSDEDCDISREAQVNIAAGPPWNSYAEAGVAWDRYGVYFGYMEFTSPMPGKKKEPTYTSGFYLRAKYTVLTIDGDYGTVFRLYLTGLGSNRFAGGSVRFGASFDDEFIMVYIEPEYLKGFDVSGATNKNLHINLGMTLRF